MCISNTQSMMNPIRLSRRTAPVASLFGLQLFFALVLLGGALLPEPVLASPRYNLGSVPDQTVWSGSSREFSLHWANRSGVVMLVEATPAPEGTLILEPLNDTDWQFQFTPAESDVTSFQVVVTALEGGQQTSQSWEMAPQAVLPPEADFFGSGPHTQAPIPPYGVTVFDQTDPVPALLNYEQQDLHRVRIVGEIVEIEAGHANGLFEAYFDGTRRDPAGDGDHRGARRLSQCCQSQADRGDHLSPGTGVRGRRSDPDDPARAN
jgi:hypothetical protein